MRIYTFEHCIQMTKRYVTPVSVESCRSLSDFRLLRRVGGGRNSTVYQAIHCPSNTTVALKVYAKCTLSAVTWRLVQREIEIQGRLDHEHIAKLVMQWLPEIKPESISCSRTTWVFRYTRASEGGEWGLLLWLPCSTERLRMSRTLCSSWNLQSGCGQSF